MAFCAFAGSPDLHPLFASVLSLPARELSFLGEFCFDEPVFRLYALEGVKVLGNLSEACCVSAAELGLDDELAFPFQTLGDEILDRLL
jgi:hypothetical protein